ncbi:hypothetical protein GQ457_06G003100 [Hibiscus cannabinus]
MEITAERESVTVSQPLLANGGQQGKGDGRVLVGQKRGVDSEGGVAHGQTEHGGRSLVGEMGEGIQVFGRGRLCERRVAARNINFGLLGLNERFKYPT